MLQVLAINNYYYYTNKDASLELNQDTVHIGKRCTYLSVTSICIRTFFILLISLMILELTGYPLYVCVLLCQ